MYIYTLIFPPILVKCLGQFALEVENLRIRKADQSGLPFKQPNICMPLLGIILCVLRNAARSNEPPCLTRVQAT